ncbi:MAG: pirin family protein [Chitinophagaceae bacterium]
MANIILHKAETRGKVSLDWLSSAQTFSFSSYYNPERMQFGALRVFNDDVVAGGRGFGRHPHDNMEIISIPLEGSLKHEDNLGNTVVTDTGDVQVMSTGTGIFHSEHNYSADKPAKFLQIWLYPNKLNVTPRYEQVKLDADKQDNQLQVFITPQAQEGQTWIYQDAWFSMGRFDKNKQVDYQLHKEGSGVYLFVINGAFTVDGLRLDARDGVGISDIDKVSFTAQEQGATILVIEMPMEV